jgi:hypothetical protein
LRKRLQTQAVRERTKMSWLQLLDSVVQIVVNTAEVTDNGSDSKRFSEKVGLRMGDC